MISSNGQCWNPAETAGPIKTGWDAHANKRKAYFRRFCRALTQPTAGTKSFPGEPAFAFPDIKTHEHLMCRVEFLKLDGILFPISAVA
ncbi:MAG: hypothetical protein MI923_01035 [Phycisphaerales bacterium]|nr:hypothetical protein [Phycisphaerales bacterium]